MKFQDYVKEALTDKEKKELDILKKSKDQGKITAMGEKRLEYLESMEWR